MAKKNYVEKKFSCVREGLTIRGLLFEPVNGRENAEGKWPVAIVSHMFMVNYKLVEKYARFLAEQGYLAVCYDFNGGGLFSKSDGKSVDMSVLTEVKDLEAVIAYARSLPYTSNELLLMGCSQGGFVSGLAAAKPETEVDKLVLFYPALCIPDDARAGRMMFARFDQQNIPERINCGPMKLGRCYVADVIDMDPYEEIKGYHGPVLIVHGTKDGIVKLDYSRQAQRAYPNAKLHIIEGGAHGFSKKHDAIAMAHLRRFAMR
jgi:dienelactone hydrolase